MNKQQHYITMDRGYNSSANRKTTMFKPMNKASSRLTPTTSQNSWLLFNPRKKICTKHNAFTITISWLLVIIAHFCLQWTQYLLMYCHNCTLLASFWSTISSHNAITAHCDLQLDLLSASVVPTITAHYYPLSARVLQVLYTMDPLPVGVLSSLHIAILNAIHLSAALLTLWHTVILIWIHYKLV